MLTNQTLLRHFASLLLLCGSMVAIAETEPNNDVSSGADAINVDGGSQTATISSVRDTDWFKFTVAQPGNCQIEVSGVERDVDIALDLYASDATTLRASKDDGFDGDPEIIAFENASTGDYFVKVTPSGFFGNSTGYTLMVKCTETPKVAGSITADPQTLTPVVAGTTPPNIEFKLLDTGGNGMGDKPVTFTLTGPAGWTSPTLSSTTKTDTDGKFTFDWKDANGKAITLNKVGEAGEKYTLKVTAEGKDKEVTLTVIPADPHHLTVPAGTTSPIEVPTYIAQTLTFEVRDQHENPVEKGKQINVEITKPDATLDSPSPLTTDDNGQVKVVFTPDQTGEYIIKAPSSSTEVMRLTSSLPTLKGEATDSKSPITFTLTGKNDKGIDGQRIDVSLQQPTGSTTASLEPSGDSTKDGGKVTVSLKDATVPGNYTVSAKLSSSKTTDGGGQEVYTVKSDDVKVTVDAPPPAAPDSLTVNDGETQTIISSDTASSKITFVLTAGGNPIGGTLDLSLKKPDGKSTACLVEATEKDCTTPVTTLEVKDGKGSVWLKDAKLAGPYTITASLPNPSLSTTPPATVTVTPGVPKQLVLGDNKPGTVQRIALPKETEEVVVKLTDQHGNAMETGKEVTVEVSLNEATSVPVTPNPTILEDGTFKLPAITFAEVGKYTVKVTLLDTNSPVETFVEVGNLAVTGGGNQTVLIPQSPFVGTVSNKSEAITLTLKNGAGVDEISKPNAGEAVAKKEVKLTLTDSSGKEVTASNLGLLEEGKTNETSPAASIPLTTDAKGEVKVILQAPATVVSEAEPVAAYKIKAEVNGLVDYTEVFVVAKEVKDLVGEGKIWPSLDLGEQLKKRQATATECEGKGWAWNASGTPVKTEATFYGGIKKEADKGAFQIKIDAATGGVKPKTVDQAGNFTDGTGDPVVVQGVIKVDSGDKDNVAGLFVLGENQFPNEKVLYMLGRPFGDIRPLLDGTKMLDELIAFRRNVTPDQDGYILLEMYREAFYYPGTLKVFFGYYTDNGTIVHNCTPIEVTITKSP